MVVIVREVSPKFPKHSGLGIILICPDRLARFIHFRGPTLGVSLPWVSQAPRPPTSPPKLTVQVGRAVVVGRVRLGKSCSVDFFSELGGVYSCWGYPIVNE